MRTRSFSYRYLALLCAIIVGANSAFASAATVCSVGVGGTGISNDPGTGGTGISRDPGTGGTGISASDAGIGTGGTGQTQIGTVGTGGTGKVPDVGSGGTGIVGVITGFASVCVNGIEAEFDARTTVSENGKPSSSQHLRVGQVVEVLAVGKGERVYAKSIHVRDVMLGPVTRVDPVNRRIDVMNQPVRWNTAVIAGANNRPLSVSEVKPGQFVRISGFRATNGEILASRIETAPVGAVRMTGTVNEVTRGQFSVNGLRVSHRGREEFSAAAEVSVEGTWQGSGIRADRVQTNSSPFAGKTDFVSVQGVLGDVGGKWRVGSSRLALDTNTVVEGGGRDLQPGELVQVEGTLSKDNELRVRKIFRGDRVARPAREEDERGSDGEQSDVENEDSDSSNDESSGDDGHSGSDSDSDNSGSGSSGASDSGGGRGSGSGNGRDSSSGSSGGGRGESGPRDSGGSHGDGGDSSHGGHDVDLSRPSDTGATSREFRNESGSGHSNETRIDRVEKIERIDKVERVDRVERIDRVDSIDRTTIERPERINSDLRPDHSGRDH
jgi:uncharacterized membrane protein YgcG